MKKILLFFVLATCIGCGQRTQNINGDIILKDAPKAVFVTTNKEAAPVFISNDNKAETFIPKYERLSKADFSMFYIKKHPETYAPYFNVRLNFSNDGKITIEGTEYFKEEVVVALQEFIDFAAEGKKAMIHLNFDQRLTINDFIQFNKLVDPVYNDNIIANPKVFVYDVNALPQCDCSL